MQEKYYELTIVPSSYYELFIDLIFSLSDEAVEEIDNKIIIRTTNNPQNLIDGIETFTQELSLAFGEDIICEISLEEKQNEDWIAKYKNSITPVSAGEFYIYPSWEESKDGMINIKLDPALAFGSGHHETTSSCLEAISKYVKANEKLLDVGTGSGILSIAASKKGAICDICDTDEQSIENSLKNFELNSVKVNRAWVGSISEAKESYDIVVANIVADVLLMISSDLKKSLKDNSILVLSGILDKYSDKVMSKFGDLTLLETISKNEWITMVYKKEKI
ncbi:MAG: 50S ribosomal protein L11 methyltransferase [Arcobacter butzleri]|nr:50S ribosomal protein L11 methyltransferase [Aliarcobacter butzleri]